MIDRATAKLTTWKLYYKMKNKTVARMQCMDVKVYAEMLLEMEHPSSSSGPPSEEALRGKASTDGGPLY